MRWGSLARRSLEWSVFSLVVAVVVSGCDRSLSETDSWPNKPGPKVVVSFAPLYCFAVNVAGDDAAVKNVMTTTGPHDFNPTEQDARLLSQADIMFVIGLGLDEHIAKKMKDGSGNTKLRIVELAERIPKEKLCEGVCTHAHHKDDPDHKHDLDPHVWLSPEHAIYLVKAIRDELKAADPERAANYDRRAAEYIAKLEKLKADGLAMLAGKADNRLISFHDSLAYFADCFRLEIRGVLTPKPGQEPDEREMKKLIRICTDETKPTRVIAVEPQYSKSNSGEVLRKELELKGVNNPVLAEIDTLETVKPADLTPDWYEQRMRANLAELAEKLK